MPYQTSRLPALCCTQSWEGLGPCWPFADIQLLEGAEPEYILTVLPSLGLAPELTCTVSSRNGRRRRSGQLSQPPAVPAWLPHSHIPCSCCHSVHRSLPSTSVCLRMDVWGQTRKLEPAHRHPSYPSLRKEKKSVSKHRKPALLLRASSGHPP